MMSRGSIRLPVVPTRDRRGGARIYLKGDGFDQAWEGLASETAMINSDAVNNKDDEKEGLLQHFFSITGSDRVMQENCSFDRGFL